MDGARLALLAGSAAFAMGETAPAVGWITVVMSVWIELVAEMEETSR